MIDIVLQILGAIILTISGFYAWSKLLNKKIDFNDYKIYLNSILLILASVINYNNVNAMVRILFIVLCVFSRIKL